MSYLETMDTDSLMILANDTRSDYNKARHNFNAIAQCYYRQAITNNYYKEQDMIDLLNRCLHLKDAYVQIRDILKARGITTNHVDNPWSNTDALFIR